MMPQLGQGTGWTRALTVWSVERPSKRLRKVSRYSHLIYVHLRIEKRKAVVGNARSGYCVWFIAAVFASCG